MYLGVRIEQKNRDHKRLNNALKNKERLCQKRLNNNIKNKERLCLKNCLNLP